MRKIKRKWMFLVVLVLLAGMLCAFTSTSQEQQVMLDHLEQYLTVMEGAKVQLNRVLDCTAEFAEDNSWDSLLKARAACYSARSYYLNLELPEFTMTDAQYDALLAAGIEADVVRQEYYGLVDEINCYQDTITRLISMLEEDVFLKPYASSLPQWIEHRRAAEELTSQYLCTSVNYLLLQLEDRTLWDRMGETYPTITENLPQWDENADALVDKTVLVLDQYEEQISDLYGEIGRSDYTRSLIQEAQDTGDMTRLSGQIHRIEGVPVYIPTPNWNDLTADCYYCIQAEDIHVIQPGEAVTQVPTSCYISWGQIPREMVEAYCESLPQWGLDTYLLKNEEQSYRACVIHGDSNLVVEWTEEDTVMYLSGSIGCLIPSLYLAAMEG